MAVSVSELFSPLATFCRFDRCLHNCQACGRQRPNMFPKHCRKLRYQVDKRTQATCFEETSRGKVKTETRTNLPKLPTQTLYNFYEPQALNHKNLNPKPKPSPSTQERPGSHGSGRAKEAGHTRPTTEATGSLTAWGLGCRVYQDSLTALNWVYILILEGT